MVKKNNKHTSCLFSLSFILPALQGLVGEKYGSIRVPGEVDSAEFEMILDAAVEAGMDTHILEEWYCRDENSVPPAYYLKPKAQMLKNYQNSVSLASFGGEKLCFCNKQFSTLFLSPG